MSLRHRLVGIVGLAVIACVAAGLSLAEVVARTDAAREADAWSSGEAMVEALGRAHRAAAERGGGAAVPREALEAAAASVVAPLVDTDAGFCSRSGVDVHRAGAGRHGEPRTHPLPPDQIEALRAACARGPSAGTAKTRIVHPHDVVTISLLWLGDEAAWALVRAETRPSDEPRRWLGYLALTGFSTLLLMMLAADAFLSLRRGTDALDAALVALQTDLRAEVPRPRARELARLAQSLRTMAGSLAAAGERARALERSLAQEQRLSALGRVAAGVAHEVRNPLAGIKLKLDAMARRRLDPRSDRDVAVCLGEVARLDRVIQSLLVVARKAPSPEAPFELGPLVDDRLEASRELAATRGVTLARSGEARAAVDPDALGRALDNLLRNAVQASPEGAAVRVELDDRGPAAHLAVIDAGPGIPPEREGELFEPFFTLKAEGTGLGLWLSRTLMEVRGGRLTYERRAGATRFTITLPKEGTHAQDPHAADRG